MNLPTQHQNVWTPAADGDKLKALALLAGLPSRQTSSAETDEASYYLALENVTKHGLFEAVKAALQHKLGHTFFPSPAELRMLCDKAMEYHVRMRDRIALRQRIARETPDEIPPRTEAEKDRVVEIMCEFHASEKREEAAKEEAEHAEIRARYGMTPEVLASMKDQPLPEGMEQVGDIKRGAS